MFPPDFSQTTLKPLLEKSFESFVCCKKIESLKKQNFKVSRQMLDQGFYLYGGL